MHTPHTQAEERALQCHMPLRLPCAWSNACTLWLWPVFAAACRPQGFTKKLQSELTLQYMRRVGTGADIAHAQQPSPALLPASLQAAAPSNPSHKQQAQPTPSSKPPPDSGTWEPPHTRVAAASALGLGGQSTGFGGLPPSSSSGSGAGSNLSALKMSVNSFTRELASSMSTISRAAAGAGSGGASPQARVDKASS